VPLAAEHDVVYTFFQNDPLQLAGGKKLDVREGTAVNQLIHTFQPDVIIHTVGSNRGDDVERVIELGTQHVTQAVIEVGARLIHLSTDSIFRGDAAPYDETAVPSPVNGYGRAKATAEAIVQNHPNAVIIRTSLIYGLMTMDHGTAWMVQALRAGQPVTLFDNQIRNPVWVQTLGRACLELVQHEYTGILNVAGRQAMSRAEFGLKMLDYWGIQERDTLTIGPSTGGEWPLDCELDLRRGSAVLNTPLYGVDEVLKQPLFS
jgi:dTDP-4-dehydrorhamnose reductase